MSDSDESPVSVARHTLEILGVTTTVHVLDDGRRIFEADAMNRILEMLRDGETPTPEEVEALAKVGRQ